MTGMGAQVELVDAQDAADLGTFLARARRLDASAVRLQAGGRVLAVTVCALEGHGLLGEGTVLGLRAFALADDATCDVVVAIDAVADRLARLRTEGRVGPQRLALPPVPVVVPWSGLAPPRSGWTPVGTVTADTIDAVANGGISEVAAAVAAQQPSVRDAVWRREIPGTDVAAGAALAVHALGFSTPEVQIYAQARWRRLSSPAGHVITR